MFFFFYFLQFTCPAASWRHNLLLWHTLASGGKKGISYESLNQLINSHSTKFTKILRWELPGAFTSYRHSLLVFLPARRRESILRCVTCVLVVVISTICVVCVQLEGQAKKGMEDEALNKSHNNTERNLLLSLNLSHWQPAAVWMPLWICVNGGDTTRGLCWGRLIGSGLGRAAIWWEWDVSEKILFRSSSQWYFILLPTLFILHSIRYWLCYANQTLPVLCCGGKTHRRGEKMKRNVSMLCEYYICFRD